MDTRNQNCGLPYDWCYYLHRSRDAFPPVCRIFHISVQINVSSTINMQTKGSIKISPCRGILLSVYELPLSTCKINIEMSLKSKSYILALDRVKLSLGIFFFLSCLLESFFFTCFQDLPFFVSKTHTTQFWVFGGGSSVFMII